MKKYHLLIIILFLYIGNPIYSQNEIESIQYSGSRIQQPVEMVVERKADKVTFYVINQSYYRFDIRLELKNIINLSPLTSSRNYSVGFGRTHLITLTRKDAEINFSYEYSYGYSLRQSDITDKKFSYLHPVGPNKYISNNKPKANFTIGSNSYVLKNNDTVFAMRKGYIVADNKKLTIESRLFDKGSLEILHDDGTVMVYMIFDKMDESLIKRGQEVYPGQPLYINKTGDKTLQIGLFNISDNKVIGIQPIFNCCNNKNILDCVVSHPIEIITQEMSKMEKRRYLKGKLF